MEYQKLVLVFHHRNPYIDSGNHFRGCRHQVYFGLEYFRDVESYSVYSNSSTARNRVICTDPHF